jgi:hypothetical protein
MAAKRITSIIYPEGGHPVSRMDTDESQTVILATQHDGRVFGVRLRVNANGAVSLVAYEGQAGHDVTLWRGNIGAHGYDALSIATLSESPDRLASAPTGDRGGDTGTADEDAPASCVGCGGILALDEADKSDLCDACRA